LPVAFATVVPSVSLRERTRLLAELLADAS
jgi:hypothetical protein